MAPDPELDPEFRALALDRRTWVLSSWDHMIELDRVRFKEVTAEAIAERYAEAAGAKRHGHGFSRTSLLRRYAEWVESGRNWRVLDRYRSLRRPKAPAPIVFNITPDAAQKYFRRCGLTAATWAVARGFNPSSVSVAINGSRGTPRSAEIIAALAADLRDEPQRYYAEIQQLREEWRAFDAKFSALEERIALRDNSSRP